MRWSLNIWGSPVTDSTRDFALAHYESGQVAESDRRQAYLSDKWPSAEEFEKELQKGFRIDESSGFWLTVIALAGAAASSGAWLAFGRRPET